MQDRQPTLAGRIKLTHDSGDFYYMERADEPLVEGTALSKANLFDSSAEERYGVETPGAALNMLGKKWDNVTFALSGWSEEAVDGYYENMVEVEGMLEVYEPWAGVVYTSAETADDDDSAFAVIKEIETADGYITAKAKELPEQDIIVRLRGV